MAGSREGKMFVCISFYRALRLSTGLGRMQSPDKIQDAKSGWNFRKRQIIS